MYLTDINGYPIDENGNDILEDEHDEEFESLEESELNDREYEELEFERRDLDSDFLFEDDDDYGLNTYLGEEY